MAQRVIITGDVGTGKTALAQHFGADITSQANRRAVKVRYVHVNCREFQGKFFMILLYIIAKFEPNFPKRGFSVEEALETFMQTLDAQNVFLILVLDEFDSLIEQEGSDTVYKLTRLQEMRSGKPQRLSFIFIMRDLKALEKLDSSARSTLQSNIICLQRYGREQLGDILTDRISLAFENAAVPEDVVCLVAELAESETGNARFAIELLWRAGKYADAEDAAFVEPECVRQAYSSITPSIRRGELASLGLHQKLFLLAAARFFKSSEAAFAMLSELEGAYAVVCEEYEVEPNSHTQVWKYVSYFDKLGVLKTEVATLATRGRYMRVFLPSIPAVELEKELSLLLLEE
jgi:cell division control protein 6